MTSSNENGYDFGPLAGAAELEELRSVLTQAFHFSTWEAFVKRVGPENFRRLRRGPGVVGGLAIYAMGQWFGGQSIPVGGIAAVGVPPEHRGQGVAFELMRGLLRELHRAGTPLSALYASTQSLYRKVGYEQGGVRIRYAVESHRIGISDHDLPVRRVDPLKHEVFHETYRRRAIRSTGNLDRGPIVWGRIAAPQEEAAFAYLIGPESAPEGYVIYKHVQGKKPPYYGLAVSDVVALTPAAQRRIWTFFADHRSLTGEITWSGPLNDPMIYALPEQPARIVEHDVWLLRIVDVPKALGMRGYPEAADTELHLDVSDAILPENAGRFVLRITGGRGEVSRGGRGDLRLDVRALAPLFTGMFSATELGAMGEISGPLEAQSIADRLFRGPAPWMPDMF